MGIKVILRRFRGRPAAQEPQVKGEFASLGFKIESGYLLGKTQIESMGVEQFKNSKSPSQPKMESGYLLNLRKTQFLGVFGSLEIQKVCLIPK